ncbi:hypothetical protein TCAL_05594 [Tigriopus californicus]|uniref:AAA+ ATPase domain-containing protein n=1 Tax=Tigriopus californicus TaxID=6832 RepID=A0A553NES2_TIGCA|nr:outer mitochondrial transmembrane helix translocase-like [Tigriopus californicus]TRY63915.1 hypothetical protein TCAL_05594 [Tigriopus californicus]|eukprot:TCALIF_05594-PA protein Name:"Similar to atad1 ATPase family AAA domain-containing protein 1 (Xenopus tropicalis)" AED:0.02 eAED:0.02 QI:294/1/1/1/1/1/2/133/352
MTNDMRGELISLVVRATVASVLGYYTMKFVYDTLDPTRKQKLKAEEKAKRLLQSLGINPAIQLNEHELMIASNLVVPSQITTSWQDIAGLEDVIQELRETVILPIQKRDLFRGSQLTQAPKGVLLHGPPGCGKTMMAKATAKEAGTRFINLDAAALTDKWYGESQKLASSVFTLAQKIQPCIIFIDEVDSLLRSRSSNDHEATAMIKTQFMQLWDGLPTNSECIVIVMGATNRPKDVDRAFLRRMPATFHIGLPEFQQRKSILLEILRLESFSEDVDFNALARLAEGFSGSDLREMCRLASVYRIRSMARSDNVQALKPISHDELLQAFRKLKESKVHCGTSPADFALPNLD